MNKHVNRGDVMFVLVGGRVMYACMGIAQSVCMCIYIYIYVPPLCECVCVIEGVCGSWDEWL